MISVTVPLRIYSVSNLREHWSKKSKRQKQQKNVTILLVKPSILDLKLPITVTLTRLAPRTLDDDNLIASFKHIRDAIADIITPGLAPGRSDDISGLSFKYSQQKSKVYEFIASFDSHVHS